MADTKEELSAVPTQVSTPEVPRRKFKGRNGRPGSRTGSENKAPETTQSEQRRKVARPKAPRVVREQEEPQTSPKRHGFPVVDGVMDVRIASAQAVYAIASRIKLAFCGKDFSGQDLPDKVERVRVSALGSAIPRIVALSCKLDDFCVTDSFDMEMMDNLPKLTVMLISKESWNKDEWLASHRFNRRD
jgi:hypothetical protein